LNIKSLIEKHYENKTVTELLRQKKNSIKISGFEYLLFEKKLFTKKGYFLEKQFQLLRI